MSAPNGTHATNGVNGAHVNGTKVSRPLTAGIFAPIPAFFDPETEDLGEQHSARRKGVEPLGLLILSRRCAGIR